MGKFLDKAPNVGDLEIQSRLNKLRKKINFSKEEVGAAATIFFPPSPPLNFLNLRLPPLPSDLPSVPRVDEFLNNDFNFEFSNSYVLPTPDPPPLTGFARNYFPNGPSTAKTS